MRIYESETVSISVSQSLSSIYSIKASQPTAFQHECEFSPPLRSKMLLTNRIRAVLGARQMNNQGVKHCQANEGADNNAENDIQCAREVRSVRTASGRCRSLWETLKLSDDKVTHHSHQKDAFGLNGEVSLTPKGH
jgi:hypothetical protein